MKADMRTPIYDFAKKYSESGVTRFHMPGHKGREFLGIESLDITEIPGADTLYSPDGIIAESEDNASRLFDTAHTYYSTEGSTLTIKAMLAIATRGKRSAKILAARGAHKAFVHAAALLDLDLDFIYPDGEAHVCSQQPTPESIRSALKNESSYSAVYITSPDYLGGVADIAGISAVCHEYGIPLLVDSAHGAYLAFLTPSRHPIALGADMCCDSAHKTLPTLTGGAYLHISKNARRDYISSARAMLSLFASTSPSYLILESLDLCNKYLASEYRGSLVEIVERIERLKKEIERLGYVVIPSEPLKIVLSAREYGYTGAEMAKKLSKSLIEVEFFDNEYVVLMATPQNSENDFLRLTAALGGIAKKEPLKKIEHKTVKATRAMSVREATLAESEEISVDIACGRICATASVSCPPAVPIVVSGELITEEIINLLKQYDTEKIEVVKNA